jgi:hypothetical protein
MQIEIGDGAFLVDAALLGELLDVSPSNVVSLMRDLAITSTCEKGIDIHQSEFRLTFFHGNRRARLRIDKSGHILQRSIIDFGERPLSKTLHKR